MSLLTQDRLLPRPQHLRKASKMSTNIYEAATSPFLKLFRIGESSSLLAFVEYFVTLCPYLPPGSEKTLVVQDLRLIKQWGSSNHAYVSASVVLDCSSVHHLCFERTSCNDTGPNNRVAVLTGAKKGPLDQVITHLSLPPDKDLYLWDVLAAITVLHAHPEKYHLQSWKHFRCGGTLMTILASYLNCKITRTSQWCCLPGYKPFVPVIAPGEKEKIVAAVHAFLSERGAIISRIDQNCESLRQHFRPVATKGVQ
ncbi:hypothetical protein CVT26_000458 [Gymnopilus dilepis]|uniref:Uncharacterized protein n=1 Tax=Gymnopilus dilepis TaxID=231916 RepID=A0A409Y2I5_9AGAR|nr:hypothetical protein CVT26_000458 [Gymnopilus dilepis]